MKFPLPASALSLCAVLALCCSPLEAAEEEDPFYEGFYSGYVAYLTQADLSIGILSDAALKGVYEKETALQVVAMHGRWAGETQKKLTAIAKDAEDDDAESIKRMAKIAGLVKKQADALKALLEGEKSEAPDLANAFTESRQATSKELAAFKKDMAEWFPE